MPTTSLTQLDVWKKARLITLSIYRITEFFPRHQLYSLTAQMQRAAISIGTNIAEGYGRRAPRDKAHFYTVSKGSAEELLHCLIVSGDLGYFKGDPALFQTLDEVGGMLRRLIQKTLTGC
jgi:four helix bundle protein